MELCGTFFLVVTEEKTRDNICLLDVCGIEVAQGTAGGRFTVQIPHHLTPPPLLSYLNLVEFTANTLAPAVIRAY